MSVKLKPSKRILHVGKYYFPFRGGIESAMQELCEAQVAAGEEVCCCVHNHKLGLFLESTELNHVVVHRSPILGRLLFAPVALLFGLHLRKIVKDFRPDIIHVHMPNVSAFWLLLSSKTKNIPVVVHWHSDVLGATQHVLLTLAYKLYRPLEQRLLRLSSAIIATSPPYAESSEPLNKWQQKLSVVPLGIRKLTYERSLPQSDSPNQQFRVLCVGRLTFYKGQEYLIRAVAALPDVRLDLVGEGDNRKALNQLIGDLKLTDRVTLWGAVTDEQLALCMQQSDCVCLPSIERTEAFGVVLLEAMRLSKPTVASNIPGSGTGWVVEHEKTGLLVQPADVKGLQYAIERLKADPVSAAKMGERGKAKFLDEFELVLTAQKIESVYASVTKVEN